MRGEIVTRRVTKVTEQKEQFPRKNPLPAPAKTGAGSGAEKSYRVECPCQFWAAEQ